MDLKVIVATGLVPVSATKDTSDHLVGDVFGLRPVNAARAIEDGFVKAATPDTSAKTFTVTVEGDVVTEKGTARQPKKSAEASDGAGADAAADGEAGASR